MKKKTKQKLKGIGLFLLGVIITYSITGIIDFIRENPDIDVIMPVELEHNQLPIILDNIGDKTLTNIKIRINSCDMDFNKSYYRTELKKEQKAIINFDEEKTINQFKKLPCYDVMKLNLSDYKVWIKVYRHNKTKELIIPYQEYAVDVCMHCYWDIYFYSDQLNKTFREETYHAEPLNYRFEDNKIRILENNLLPEFKPYSPIGISLFDDRIWEAYT